MQTHLPLLPKKKKKAILNFSTKFQNEFISQTVQDGGISTTFTACRVYAESSAIFLPKIVAVIFAGHLEFLYEIQKLIYLGNGAR